MSQVALSSSRNTYRILTVALILLILLLSITMVESSAIVQDGDDASEDEEVESQYEDEVEQQHSTAPGTTSATTTTTTHSEGETNKDTTTAHTQQQQEEEKVQHDKSGTPTRHDEQGPKTTTTTTTPHTPSSTLPTPQHSMHLIKLAAEHCQVTSSCKICTQEEHKSDEQVCKETGYHQIVTCTTAATATTSATSREMKQSCTPAIIYTSYSFWNVLLFQILLIMVVSGTAYCFYKRKQHLFEEQQQRLARLTSA